MHGIEVLLVNPADLRSRDLPIASAMPLAAVSDGCNMTSNGLVVATCDASANEVVFVIDSGYLHVVAGDAFCDPTCKASRPSSEPWKMTMGIEHCLLLWRLPTG